MKHRFSLALLCPLLSLIVLCFGSTAQAQLTFSLTQPTLTASNGSTLTFAGTLTNAGTDELFLNGDLFTLSGDGLSLDDSPFLSNFPLSLLGGETASGDLFTVTLGPTPPVTFGAYSGTFTIVGGASDTDQSELATQSFSVVAAPEPATAGLVFTGLLACGAVTLRCRRRASDAVADRKGISQ